MGKSQWREADSLAGRLSVWRSDIDVYKSGQNPISDRYIVTCYGGVIDLRHFLYTASKVLSSPSSVYWRGLSSPIEPRYARRNYRNPLGRPFPGPVYRVQLALYDTYCVERGREYEIAKAVESSEAFQKLAEEQYCTPEDLSSSALGAAFAQRLMGKQDVMLVDVEEEIGKFLEPFIPVPDKVRALVSHNQVVFGVEDTMSEPIPVERLTWFKAEPIIFTKLLNESADKAGLGKICDDVADGNAALAKAGYEVAKIAGGLPLAIRPIKE
jgi:hypothetical protein